MKRILPLLLVLPLAAFVACKDSSDSNGGQTNGGGGENNGGGGGGGTGGPGGELPPGVNPDDLAKNPIEGVAEAKAVLETGAFTDGPVWHAQLGVLFFSTPLGEGAVYRMLPDGRVIKIRDGNRALGEVPIGNTVNAAGELVTVEAKRLVRQLVAAEGGVPEPTVIATGYAGGTPGPEVDGGAPVGPGTFDTLNDVVARKDGTMYVTDPGYFAEPLANRIYRVGPEGTVQVVEAFEDVPRPNGIALSPDEKSLYVGFSAPIQGTLPFVRKYIVNDDGTLGEWTKFIDVGPADSTPDGLAVDLAGNVYVATKAGIEVYKADASKIGVVAIPEKPTGITFGGADMKTLYVTTEGVKIWSLTLNVPGVSQ